MDDHPLRVELARLRTTAAQYQHEAHVATVQLRRHAHDAARVHALEQEHSRLAHESDTLRAHPEVSHHPAVEQAQELSLALRRVTHKIALTEDALLERTSELVDARSEVTKARHAADGAYALAARVRAREEASRARQRDLELRARASEQERSMVDRVVQEYADLVRTLEGRKSANPSLLDTLQDGKSSLHSMLTAFSAESEQLHATIAERDAEISDLQMTLDAERTTASHDRTLLSRARTELDKLRLEDQTAAKMVARYMKFSQASTNALQEQITTLKTRHASTTDTLQLKLSLTESQLASERARTEHLQDALDDLCEDLARESYGRRREVSLRLGLLSREEATAEHLRRWARRASESYARCYSTRSPADDPVQEAFHRVVSDAVSLLSTLDDDVQVTDDMCASGSVARVALASEAVDALGDELQDELQKRIDAVRKFAFNDKSASEIEDSNAEHAESPRSHTASPVSALSVPEESADDPFVVPTAVISIEEAHSFSSPPAPDSASTLATLLVDEEPKTHSPAVSILDLQQDPEPPTESPSTEEVLPDDISPPEVAENTTPLLPASTRNILSELGATRHRYDALQHAFRDCSLALKDLQRTLPPPSPPTRPQPTPTPDDDLRRHLAAALVHLADYTDDARVELEIRIADDALTARGFETVLSVPGALGGEEARAEVEEQARAFVAGREGEVGAMERFGRRLEDVQHDVAVVKRALHALAMADAGAGEAEAEAEGAEETQSVNGTKDRDAGGWTAWTASFLGPTRPPSTPLTQTFGAVMTSPRIHRAASLTSQPGRPSTEPARPEGPLAGLGLRIALPPPAPSVSLGHGYPYSGLGTGRPGVSRPRTISAMYTLGGMRSSSVLGVGLGSPSSGSGRTRMGGARGRDTANDAHAPSTAHALGDVE